MKNKKLHWFCFSYVGYALENGKDCKASWYAGYVKKNITNPMIMENKKSAGVTDAAVLISCSYLGHMPKAEFEGQE